MCSVHRNNIFHPHKVKRYYSDEKIPLDFIYSLMVEYSKLDYKKYFPTYCKMIENEKQQQANTIK